MTLRAATSADVPQLTRLVEDAYGHYVERLGGRPGPMDEDYADVLRRRNVVVDDRGGRIVGLLVLGSEDGGFWVHNVAVDPAWQGRGVGRALLQHAEQA